MAPDSHKEKAREIAYALIRVAFYVKRQDLHLRLENLAFGLLEDSAIALIGNNVSEFIKVLADISAIDCLVRLGHSIYEIEPVNATILVRELDKFNSAIRQFSKDIELKERLPDLDSFFSEYQGFKNRKNSAKEFKVKKEKMENINETALPITGNITGEPVIKSNVTDGLNAAIRQSAIIEKIKVLSGNCRLKDLIAHFPEISERTLRYDLQKLCEQEFIERVGNGGPASYYKMVSNNSILSEAEQ